MLLAVVAADALQFAVVIYGCVYGCAVIDATVHGVGYEYEYDTAIDMVPRPK